jgi:hypothetical protein
MYNKLALIASILLPLWNIPLIIRIKQRKSSSDISLLWLFGVWICSIIMLPAGIKSSDIIWKSFSITNIVLFTCVVITALIYRRKN